MTTYNAATFALINAAKELVAKQQAGEQNTSDNLSLSVQVEGKPYKVSIEEGNANG
jgi:hypothetical protein